MQTRSVKTIANQAWVLVMRRGQSIEEAAATLHVRPVRLERLITAFAKRRASEFGRDRKLTSNKIS
jgi:hypothetical protein